MQRFWLFFYGLPNIVGIAFLILGIVGYIFSLRMLNDISWVVIVAAMLAYPLGWLLGFILQKPSATLQFEQNLTAEQISEQLNRLLRKVKNRISPEAFAHLQNIQNSVMSVLPHLVAGRFANQDLFTVKKTVFDYLPTTLENYLKLPAAYASIHVIHEGKTAKMLLNEQLALIDNSMQKVVESIYHDDAQALLVNERFLENRLKETSFLI